LAGANGATYQLAIAILFESYKLDQMAINEIVLSERVTGLFKDARKRAINNLVELRLIKVKRAAGRAVRVVDLFV